MTATKLLTVYRDMQAKHAARLAKAARRAKRLSRIEQDILLAMAKAADSNVLYANERIKYARKCKRWASKKGTQL